MAMCGLSAWADGYDGSSPVYSPTNGTNYATLAAAMSAFDVLADNSSFEIDLYGDVTIASRITCTKKKTLTIKPMAANLKITRGSLGRNVMWFLVNDGSSTLNIGSDDYSLTIQGGGSGSSNEILNAVCARENGKLNLTNVTFNNFSFNSETKNGTTTYGYLYYDNAKSAGVGPLVLKNVSVSNCSTALDAFIKSTVTNNDAIYIQTSLNFSSCTGTHLYINGRIRLGDVSGSSATTITASTPITVYWASSTTALSTPVVVKANKSMVSNFVLTNADLALAGNGTDLQLTEFYPLTTGAAGAATLILPFASTVPSGATAYTLTHTSGNHYVDKSDVGTTLNANTPVLVIAEAGTYKFINTSVVSTATVGAGTHTSGALTGVYATTTPESGKYILYCDPSDLTNYPVGFYKCDGTNQTVDANRAYLTLSGSLTAPRIDIDFNNTTGVSSVKALQQDDAVYNLQGVRVENPRKGIYVKNGKKYVVK